MTERILRALIQEKLVAGRLPYTSIPRLWGGPGSGEICDGCDETVRKDQMVLENRDAAGSSVQFHVSCFHVWKALEQWRGRLPAFRLVQLAAGLCPTENLADRTVSGVYGRPRAKWTAKEMSATSRRR
jgi:hypothetical protein